MSSFEAAQIKYFLIILCCSFCNGCFTLVGSRTTVFKEDYKLYVTCNDPKQTNSILVVELIGKTTGDIRSKEIPLGCIDQQQIIFENKNHHTFENFSVTSKIKNSHSEQSVDVYTIAQSFSVFIQTDKAIYKPGDKVQFRVIVIDAETKPYQNGAIDVNIADPNGRTFFSSADDELDNLFTGVHNASYELSDSSPLGNWSINVNIKSVNTSRSFEVSETVLPRFNAQIESNSDVLLSDGKIDLTVFGEYSFGEFVKGKASVTVEVFKETEPEIVLIKKTKNANVSAKKRIEFEFKRELKINSLVEGSILMRVHLTITESLTDKNSTEVKIIRIHKKAEHKIELIRPDYKLQPGFPYKLRARVTRFDGSYELNESHKIKFNVVYKKSPNRFENLVNVEKVLKGGSADCVIGVPELATSLTVTLSYLNAQTSVNMIAMKSESGRYLKIRSMNEKPRVGDNLKLTIESTKRVETIYAVITGHLKIDHKTIKLSPSKRTFELEQKVTRDMFPTLNVIAYFMDNENEIVFDRLTLDVNNSLEKQLDIKLSTKLSSVGAEANFSIKTSPKAYVGLLAVDKRVLYQKSSNDLDKTRLMAELMQNGNIWRDEPFQVRGASKNFNDFGESNAFLMTGVRTIETRFSSQEDDYNIFVRPRKHETPPAERQTIRKDFPETWIFDSFIADASGEYILRKTVPDTITSWVVTGFSLDPETGLHLSEPQQLYVKQDFFIKLSLPYSIRFGEILKVQVDIFNYVKEREPNLSVDVTMSMDWLELDFEFLERTSKCGYETLSVNESTKAVSVAQYSSASTHFYIKPLKVGKIKFCIKAVGVQVDVIDEIEREFKVEYDGVTTFINKPILIDLDRKEFDSLNYEVLLDDNMIQNSLKVGASVIGDMMGPVLVDVSKLIRLPTGCGEQRLLTFVPTILATKYLSSINKLTGYQKKSSSEFLKIGYNQMLERKNSDGSFNLWGYEKSDSIWLSAYVLKCFGHVKYLININDHHIYGLLNFLKSKQKSTGSFSEYGPISHRRAQGGVSNGVPLTAYVIISFLENHSYMNDYNETVSRSLDFIDKNLKNITDNYAVAISAYALVLGKHKAAESFLDHLQDRAIVEEDKMHWQKSLGQIGTESDKNLAHEVELAAYALLAFLKFDNSSSAPIALKIRNWLISKRNSEGGFYSTQDTVIGIQALAMYASKYLQHSNTNMKIKLGYGADEKEINLNKSNSLSVQDLKFPMEPQSFKVNAKGTGKALLNIWYSYNSRVSTTHSYKISPRVLLSKTGGLIYLTVCISSLDEDEVSKMAILEINLPSGFVYDSESTQFLKEFRVKKVETRDRKTTVILYFDNVTQDELCPEIKAIREQEVEQLKSSSIKLYDYYSPEKQTVEYYSTAGAQSCLH